MTRPQNDAGQPRRAVFLTGFMGAGKTSVGRVLAERLGWQFVDLDERIEARVGRRIADIFRDSGEAAFRRAEAIALGELLACVRRQPLVVALGGGTIAQPDNARALKAARVRTVFLDAEVAELRRRCMPKGEQRPLFQDENQFRQLYESRRRSYMEADFRVDSTGLSVKQAAAEVARCLGFEWEAIP